MKKARDRNGGLINNQYHTDVDMGILKEEYKGELTLIGVFLLYYINRK
ncbi:hypothetical protein [Mammaliicoccus lentus]|nr:hypothetical protein [Mammaliicoccus lentus]